MVAIFVAFMFLSLVITDLGVQKFNAWQTARATSRQASAASFADESLWQVPEGVHLSGVHTWFRPDPAGGLEIGADSLIAHALGSVARIVLPRPGDDVASGQPLFSLEHNGRSITVPSTITGKIVAINTRLQDQPALLNSDPYGRGWVCRVTPTSLESVTPSVLFGEKAVIWMESEFNRLREFLAANMTPEFALGAVSQDGGIPISGCLTELDKTAWAAFETEFLNKK